MKRSPMKRKPPPPSLARVREWTGASPSPRAVAVSRVDTRARLVVPVGKEAPVRDEAYRRFVASHACFACGIAGHSQCAHANLGKGGAIKAGDDRTFPLCASMPMRVGCHDQHDQCIDMTRDERREREAEYVARMQAIARAAGWFSQEIAA